MIARRSANYLVGLCRWRDADTVSGMSVRRAEPALASEPAVERLELSDGAWVDLARGVVHESQALYDSLVEGVEWHPGRIFRYERWVDVPRLGAWSRLDQAPHPVLLDVTRWLTRRYRVRFDGFALAWYRDGRDGQAFHRDRDLRYLDDTVIAVLSLGARRPWLLRPREHRHRHDLDHGGAVHDLAPEGGDLLVMGGRCQADWEHSVPTVHTPVAGRISVQWRWTSRRGRPVVGASYRAPRHFSG
jgi:alkylated DNA repair dioxygenase AlkB